VSNNSVPVADLPTLISDVNAALVRLTIAGTEPSAEPLKPAVPGKRSLHPDHIVCLEDGLKFKSLRRHLLSHHGMSPEEYREKWGAAVGLSDGCSELFRRSLGPGQEDGAWT